MNLDGIAGMGAVNVDTPEGNVGAGLMGADEDGSSCSPLVFCLGPPFSFQKISYDTRHIKSLDTCIKY